MNGIMYRLVFASGKSYIGIIRKGANTRMNTHRADMVRGKDSLIYRAWRKHGEPILMVMAHLEDSELEVTEIRAISVYGTLTPNGYNSTTGGDISPPLMDHVARKIGDRHRGRIIGPEWRAKLSAAAKGRKKSDLTKSRMSASLRMRFCKEETKRKISAASRTPERVAALIARNKARGIAMKEKCVTAG